MEGDDDQKFLDIFKGILPKSESDVKDLKLEKATIINDAEHVIVNIAITREEAEPEATDAAAEPEVTEKGKKEDGAKAEDAKKDKADEGKKK